jgi:hypothetical protein
MENLKITVKYGSLPVYNDKTYIILISNLYSLIYDKRLMILRGDSDQNPFLVLNITNISMIK